jgi:hypothetical protein
MILYERSRRPKSRDCERANTAITAESCRYDPIVEAVVVRFPGNDGRAWAIKLTAEELKAMETARAALGVRWHRRFFGWFLLDRW